MLPYARLNVHSLQIYYLSKIEVSRTDLVLELLKGFTQSAKGVHSSITHNSVWHDSPRVSTGSNICTNIWQEQVGAKIACVLFKVSGSDATVEQTGVCFASTHLRVMQEQKAVRLKIDGLLRPSLALQD